MSELALFDEGDLPPVSEPAPRGLRVGHTGKDLLVLLDDGEWRSTTWLAGMLQTVRRYGVNQETVGGALKRLVEVGLAERQDGKRGYEWRKTGAGAEIETGGDGRWSTA